MSLEVYAAYLTTEKRMTDNTKQAYLRDLRHFSNFAEARGIDDPAERRANVLDAYEAVSPEQFAGKRLLLVDDICTTGATLGECARVLKAAGAADVMCLTLAMVRE